MTINRAGETSTSLLIRKEDASPPILADGRGEAIPEMANVTRYKTTKGETRYRVRYRKPDGTQTDKRGFRRKIDAENWAAEHVTIAKATNSYVDPEGGKRRVGDLYEQWLKENGRLEGDHADQRHRRMEAPLRGALGRPSDRHRHPRRSPGMDQRRHRELGCSLREPPVPDHARHLPHGRAGQAHTRQPLRKRRTAQTAEARKSRRVYLTIPRLLAFADECSKGKHLGEERRALVLTLGFCGLRWGEAAALKARDLDFDRGVLHVGGNLVYVGARWVEGSPKNSEERDVPMPLIVMEALKPICGERGPDERVFRDLRGGPIMKQSAAKTTGWWHHALVRLGWPKEDWPTPHDLRHTAASLAVHAGANVKALQRMLGHKNASMTLDVYADLFDSDLMDVARLLDAAVQVETGVETCGQNVGKNVLKPA